MDIADIYRNIGKIVRNYGALRVYIIKSKTLHYGEDIQISLEVIADHIDDCKRALDEIQKVYPNVQCMLYNGENPENCSLLLEAEEEGIQL